MNSKEFACNTCSNEEFACSSCNNVEFDRDQQFGCGGFPIDEESLKKFPEFGMVCNSCQHEFSLEVSMFEVENAVCPSCQSSDLKNLYISFPEDGPGYKDPKTFYGFGGCD